MKAVSIITPCFNAGELIRELANCLCSQTTHEFEWIIVDDGSDETTVNILKQIETTADLQVLIVYAAHAGAQVARNNGFARSSGPFIKFIDADDLVDETLVANQLETARQRPDHIVVSPTARLFESGTKRTQTYSLEWEQDPLRCYLRAANISVSGCLIPREFVEAIGGWDEDLSAGQDLDFLRRLLARKYPLALDQRACYIYRQHSRAPRISQLRQNTDEKLGCQLLALDKFAGILADRGLLEEYRYLLAQNYDRWAIKVASYAPGWAKRFTARCRAVCPGYRPSGSPMLLLRRLLGVRATSYLRNWGILRLLVTGRIKLGLQGDVHDVRDD